MKGLRFSWDVNKERANRSKHGVSFAEAESVFHDDSARLIDDPDHSHDEERFILLGMSLKLRVLVVVHCYRIGESIIRIISARKADKTERKQYEELLK